MWVPILFVLSATVNVIVSLLTAKPDFISVNENTWSKQILIDDLKEHKGLKWYKNFYVLSILLIIAAIIEYIIFW